MERQKIAVIGGGVAGLSSAWLLSKRHAVTLFERNDYIGGHTHTVEVKAAGETVPVDTGFIVYNELNYPHLTALFETLGVASRGTDMSFSASIGGGTLEYAGSNLGTLFAQRRNLVSRAFLGMVKDIVRFNAVAKKTLVEPSIEEIELGSFLEREGFGQAFRNHYLLPMAAAIWSCPTATMLRFPLESFLRFFANHRLIDLFNRPQWRTVSGGSYTYVKKMLTSLSGQVHANSPVLRIARDHDQVWVLTADGKRHRFDQVVLACHADEALEMIDAPSFWENKLLSCFKYQRNHAVLHTDEDLMPQRRNVWSAWNYLAKTDGHEVSVTYWMNQLQGLPGKQQYFVSLNPIKPVRKDKVIQEMDYDHPVFSREAILAQRQLHQIQGKHRLWFCGSYCGYGFHEDALRSAVEVADALGVLAPWLNAPTQNPNTLHTPRTEPVYP